MKPMALDGTKVEGRRSEALRRLCEQAMAKPAHIWEELESQGIHVTPGVIYQAIRHYNLQPKTPDEGQGAEAMMGDGKGISLKDVECVLSIAEKAGGVRRLMRLLRIVEQVPR
jgi:hypothetical protein